MPSRYRALTLALPLLLAAVATRAAPAPPASFVSYDDTPSPPPGPPPPASPITDHLALNAGFMWGRVNTFGQFNGGQANSGAPLIAGTPLTAEQTLGLTNQSYQPQLELIFRLEERNKLRVDWFDLRRNGEVLLSNALQVGDQAFLAGQSLQSMLNWRQMDITYTYSFLRRERFELGAGLGVHFLEAEARVQVPTSPQLTDYSQAGPFATSGVSWHLAVRESLVAECAWAIHAADDPELHR